MRFVSLSLFVLMACEPMPATGDPLAPVPVRPTVVTSPTTGGGGAPATGSGGAGGFDFDADAGGGEVFEDVDRELTPAQLLAMSQGKEPPPASDTPPEPAPRPAPVAPAPLAAPIASSSVPVGMPVWDPSRDVAADWGVRLVSTLVDTQPPRAVLGLPNGTEVVVQPGTFLPDQRLVVMAVGRNAVQVSRVVPEGYQARVETHTLSSLFPSGPVSAPN